MRLKAVATALLATFGALLVGATSASANWGPTVTISARAAVPLGAVDDRGVLHTNYQLESGPTLDHYADVTPDGQVASSRSALDRRGLPASTQDPTTTFTFLANGDAVRCALRGNLNTTGNLSAYFYSQSGALIKRVELADADNVFDLNSDDECEVVSTGDSSAIMWAVPDPTVSAPHQSGRQLLVSRILPGLKLSAPVPVLPDGADQLAEFEGGVASLAVTKTGWIAVAWPYLSISKETRSSVSEVTQWRARWMSPTGALGPVIPLEKPRTETCRYAAPTCDLYTAFHLGAIADQEVMVVADTESTWGTLNTAGAVSAPRPLPFPFPPSDFTSVAFGDYKAMASWLTPNSSGTVWAREWSGERWGAPHRLAQGHGGNRTYPTDALMSQRGEGCVIWYRTVDPGFDAGAYAAFDR